MSTPVCRITNAAGKVSEYTDIEVAMQAIHKACERHKHTYIVGVCGARDRNTAEDEKIVQDMLDDLYLDAARLSYTFIVVSGACPKGADTFAAHWSRRTNVPLIEFPAQWELYSKAAGFKRNKHIAVVAQRLIALPAGSGGTENTIEYARSIKRSVVVL